MTKFRGLLLLILSLLLLIFAMENWHYPSPPVKFLGLTFLPIPQALIIYSCFLMGFLAGWLAHARKAKKQKKD
ncbi:MAG: LapA family protein [Thermodesulfobacteriota bacterium]